MQAVDSKNHRYRYIRKLVILLFILALIVISVVGIGIFSYLAFPPAERTILVVGWDHSARPQSDSVVLLHIRPQTFQISQFVLPSDMLLTFDGDLQPIHDFDSSQTIANSLTQQLNIKIDIIIELYYENVEALVEAVNGVPLYVPRVIEDNRFPSDDGDDVQRVWFNSGLQTLSAEQALNYTRTVQVDGTIARSNRQLDIVAGFSEKLGSPRTWFSVLQVSGQVQFRNVNFGDIVALFPSFVLSQGRFEQWEFSHADFRHLSDTEKVLVSETFDKWLDVYFRS